MNLKFIDLFAGIWWIRLWFQDFFWDCVFSSEIDKYAQLTYQTNFWDIPFWDITKIDEKDIPKFDILLAWFPCQPFSNAWLKKWFEDSRWTLFFDIARIINYHKPKIVFLENVKWFKNHNKGTTFETIKNTLQEMWYKVYDKILNAKDFWVPQNRERIYIVAFLDNIDFIFPSSYLQKVRVGDILENNVSDRYTISDKLWIGHQRRKIEHIKKGNGFGYSLFNKNSLYTSTISARYYKDGSEILIEQIENNPRRLTPREAARLQGFPDSFKIPVSDTQAYKQFGNSVSIPVIKALAKQIKLSLEKPYKKGELKELDLFSYYNYDNRKIATFWAKNRY